MEEFEQLLKEYGLRLEMPNQTDQMMIRKKHSEAKDKNAFKMFPELILYNAKIRVDDIERVFEKFNIEEMYAHLKKVISHNMILDVYVGRYTKGMAFEFDGDTDDGDLEEDIARDPEAFGISVKEIELMELYTTQPVRENKARELTNEYYNFLDVLDEKIQVQKEEFLQSIKQTLKSVKMDREWLEEKLKQSTK